MDAALNAGWKHRTKKVYIYFDGWKHCNGCTIIMKNCLPVKTHKRSEGLYIHKNTTKTPKPIY